GWSGYVVSFLRDLGIPISDQFATSPLAYDAAAGVWSRTGAVLNVPAMLIIAAISSLLVIGIRESSRFNNVIVVIKVAIVVAFIVAGIVFVGNQNWVTAGQSRRRLHSAKPRSRHFWLEWSSTGRRCRVLRLYRLRCGLDRVAGGHQPSARMPIGILGSLGVLYAVICAGELCHHRHHAL